MPPFPELKDISPPSPPPFSSPEEIQALVWQIFGAVAAVVLIAAAWLWWRWRVRRAQPPPLPQPALDQLRDRLTALHPQLATLPPAAIGEQVSHALRTYLQREHGLMARYRTTEELLGTSSGLRRPDAPPPLPFLRPFAEVLPLCDTLKFAGSGLGSAAAAQLIDRALAATSDVRAALAQPPVMPPPPPPEPTDATGGFSATAEPPPVSPEPAPPPATEAAAANPPPARPSAPPVPPAPGSMAAAPTPAPSPPPPRDALPTRTASPRSDSFTRPPTAAFARGADVIPA